MIDENRLKILVDGVEAPASRSVVTTKTEGTVKVEYVATTAHGDVSRVYNIPVLSKSANEIKPSDYMLTEKGSFELTDTNAGLQMLTTEDSQAYWAYPLVTGASTARANITLSLLNKTYDNGTPDDKTDDYKELKNAFEYVDIVFTDYQDATKEMFVRVYRECELNENMSYLQINGVGTKYLIDGALNNYGQNVRFYVNTATNQLYNSVNFVPVAPLPADFTATLSKVSVRFGGVTGEAGIVMKDIGNQSLNAGSSWKDNIAPMVSLSRELPSYAFISVNSAFIVPSMAAYDLRSFGAKVVVQVLYDGAVIYTAENPTEEKLITADKVGTYTIIVTPTDAGNKSQPYRFIYKTVDETAPVLTVEKTIIDEIDNGTTILVPNATATDNVDAECKVYVYITKLETGKVYEVAMGETFQFTITGNYQLRYFAYDSDYNCAEYVMNIKVK